MGEKIHETQPDKPTLEDERKPFNDVIAHIDAIQGYRSVKQIDQYQKKVRRGVKLYAIIIVVTIFFTIVWSLLR